ncbi:transcriptional regulator NikR, CopG family [Desulfurobacterium thermolithotrophum DSM 11699]|uniref:Putative nickel-responsive regulator n=1 Tax=Desulfurobacterium thermolithotrophum (strain DSM 11699 / BSA) TaxID=868864 RepID=F0S051_DESTD|nr:nickel-responsive transcriptional regulator NikR [Desulfurobacterium thermolithotrophum]ADY73732.1 transcriptional regulator NikR, CopG family [Desulfurobacterium thermolithotrophum DSM 11699]
MGRVARFAVSIDEKLLEKFDQYIEKKGYVSRSEAVRDLIRNALIEESIGEDREVFGTITIVYDHHQKELAEKITDIEHGYLKNIISTMHIHIDHNHCLETIAVRGKASVIKELADKIITLKGVKHGKLVVTGIEP